MSAVDVAVDRLTTEEGFRGKSYRDTAGRLTIGYGFCVDAGITQYAAKALMIAQVNEIQTALQGYWWAQDLDDARMSVILDIAFNDGTAALLHFVKMLAAVGAKDWATAKAELLNSEAAAELPTRYAALAQTLLTGT